MRKTYQSDISREQFEQIRALLESACMKTKPLTVDLYEVFCAVLYLLKSSCQWRMLPGGISDVAHSTFLLRQMERARSIRNQPAGAGIKKIRSARPVPDKDATP